ncbi:carboxypeptidase-like regulatory domain-containing protein [Tenacibaculum dicentrarchi]|nr:carboxypeptidase-like regulatory domain-containing protein [Tenacibaculum dicentrarchi]
MKKKLLILLLLATNILYAQLTLQGTVIDEFNNPMPFVSVYLKNTVQGTTTNNKGEFYLKTKKKKGVLEISFVGFQTQTLPVNQQTKNLKIIIKEDANELDEVIIVTKPKKRLKKKENPAYKILKEIWKRKRKNGLDLVDYYQYKKHSTTEIGLNNLDTTFLKRIFKKQYKETLNKVKYDSDGVNYYIPIYIKEQVSKVYGNNKNKTLREDIEAEKIEGLGAEGFVFNRIANTFEEIDIFKNNITLLDKSFVSPLSSDGFATYDYVLYDSIIKNNKKLYNIYFFPIRDGDLAFQGNFWVTDTAFSINKIKMKVHESINLNFVRSLSFEKEFKVKNDSIYISTKNGYEGDFTVIDKSDKNKGLTVKKNTILNKHLLNKPLAESFYLQKRLKIKPNQYKKEASYWNSKQNDDKKSTYKLIQEVKEIKQIKNITGLINMLASGYVDAKYGIQFGSLWNILGNNQVEGYRIKFGFRTYKSREDRFRLKAHLAYGLKDKKIKYGAEARYLLSYTPRISVGVAYQKDIEQLGSVLLNTSQLLGGSIGTGGLLSRGDNFFLSKVEKIATNFDYQLQKNLHIGINFAHSKIQSASPVDFSINYKDENNIIQSQITDVTSSPYISFTPGRYVYGLGVQRSFGGGIYPTFILNYRRGYKGFFNGSHNYDKLQFKYNQPILLGKFGIFNATFEAGKTFGTVPIALLNVIPANQTFTLVENTFALLNYYDFVTDKYVASHFEHNFNGFILNRIPLLNKLKLRSLLTFRAAYGTISDKNIAANKSNINYNAPNKVYYEYGVGLDNIGYGNLRFLRIDAIWRSNYTPPAGSIIAPTPKFSIRLAIKPSL